LRCPFCGERGHEHLGSLVLEEPDRRTVDVCERCRHYVKALTVLAPIRPEQVFLHDLATLVLDVIALGRGYLRPAAKGQRVEILAKPSRLGALLRPLRWTTG
jgi:FdhE protein